MNERAVALPFIPRGRSVACHECGRPSVRLKLDGRLYKHKVPGMAGVWKASGRLPTLVEASVSAPAGANQFSQPDSHAPNVIQQAMPPIFLDRILGRVGLARRFWPPWFPSTQKDPPFHSRIYPRTLHRLPTCRLPKSKPESPRF